MSLFSVLRIAVVAVLLSLVLSGCFGISDAEFRAKTCPTCNDAQWSATKAEIKKKQDEKAYAQFLVKKRVFRQVRSHTWGARLQKGRCKLTQNEGFSGSNRCKGVGMHSC